MNQENQKAVPTRSQIDVIMSDWLGNLRCKDKQNFTHKGKGGIVKEDADLIDYMVGEGTLTRLSEDNLIKTSRQTAEQIINAVVSEPVIIQVGHDASFQTEIDGKKVIALATDYFDDKELTSKDKMNIMLGLASHESAHAVYTEKDAVEKLIKKEPDSIKQLKKNIWNIIEDERIEYLLGEERPGLVDAIGKTKEYYFKKLLKRLNTDGKAVTEPLPKFLNALTQAVRYPSEMTREQAEENFEYLDAVRKILTPYPLTPLACQKATEKIMDVIKDMIKDEMDKQQEQQGGGQNQQSGGQPQQGSPQNTSGSSKSPTKKEIEQALEKALGTQQAQKVMQAIEDDNNKSKPDKEASPLTNENDARYINEDDAEKAGTGAGSGNPEAFVYKPKGDATSYLASLTRIRKYIPAMSKALTCKTQENEYIVRGLPSGKLITNKLVGYKAGNKNIFSKQSRVSCSSASVCMLIDESGSMGGQRLYAARDAAVLVNEAIKRINNVNFFCYGFTSQMINVYSENGKTSKWALGSTDNISGTPTGMAMKLVGERMRRFTSDKVLLLVLTDGAADSSQRVIAEDENLRKKGFIPIGVGILNNHVKNTFKEYIVMNDISELALEMGKLTRSRLNKMLVRTEDN